jgi:acetyl esterase/lipase
MSDGELDRLRHYLRNRVWPTGLHERRREYDAIGDKFELAVDVQRESVEIGGVSCEWTWCDSVAEDRAIIFLHGGGYRAGSLKSHRHLASEIARAVGCRSLAVDYRLAPEHSYPVAIEDAMAVYRTMLKRYAARNIVLVGDSAGGGLAVALMMAARDAGLDQPACAWLISPFTDLEATGRSYVDKKDIDPSVTVNTVQVSASTYLNGQDLRTPNASVIHGDIRGVAPLLIFVGSHEVLMDDSVEICRTAGRCDVYARLEIWPNMVHSWPLYHSMIGDGMKAIQAGAAFLREWIGRA